MAYKGQSSFRIIAILYTYWACKTLFRPIKSTNPSVWTAYKGQSSFGIIAILYTYPAYKTLFGSIKTTNPSVWRPTKARAVSESLSKDMLSVGTPYPAQITSTLSIAWQWKGQAGRVKWANYEETYPAKMPILQFFIALQLHCLTVVHNKIQTAVLFLVLSIVKWHIVKSLSEIWSVLYQCFILKMW